MPGRSTVLAAVPLAGSRTRCACPCPFRLCCRGLGGSRRTDGTVAGAYAGRFHGILRAGLSGARRVTAGIAPGSPWAALHPSTTRRASTDARARTPTCADLGTLHRGLRTRLSGARRVTAGIAPGSPWATPHPSTARRSGAASRARPPRLGQHRSDGHAAREQGNSEGLCKSPKHRESPWVSERRSHIASAYMGVWARPWGHGPVAIRLLQLV
jgi:hypothetical protein